MTTPLLIGAVLLGIFFLLILLNVPIGVALGVSSMLTLFSFGLRSDMFASIVYAGLGKYALLAIPFFVLAGVVMEETEISSSIVEFFALVVGPIPGGLAIMSLIVCLFWGAVSGSSSATVAALGVVLIPGMVKAGYDSGFAAALIAAAGGLSILIPPSVPFVLYGTLANVSIGGLFIAGIIPGILMAACMGVYIIVYCRKKNLRGIGRFGTRKEIWAAFKKAFWGLLTPVIILGGIYSGVFTPTEAAIVATWYAIIIGVFVYRSFSFKSLPRIFSRAGVVSASVLMILSMAALFAFIMTGYGVASAVSKALVSVSTSPLAVLSLIMLIMIIGGFFLDGNSLMYICVPIFLPVITSYGYSPMWLGVVMTASVVVGVITPPVAANIYPAAKIAGISLVTISKSIIWFVVACIIGSYILLYFPEITLFLPRLLGFTV